MIFKWLAIAFLAAVITGPASAQTTNATSHKEGEWRGSKLAGVAVYNEANEKIGDVNDVILDRSGKVSNVILGVGGVLGLGEHYVAVPFDKLKWVDQPVILTTASTTSANVSSLRLLSAAASGTGIFLFSTSQSGNGVVDFSAMASSASPCGLVRAAGRMRRVLRMSTSNLSTEVQPRPFGRRWTEIQAKRRLMTRFMVWRDGGASSFLNFCSSRRRNSITV